jgi:predicted chitinase
MLTLVHLTRIMRHASHARLAEFLPALNEVMQTFEIDTRVRASAFLAQLAHESGEFQFMEELWGPTAAQKRYEPVSDLARRLGNTEPGDGKRFKGRGPIQITGRDNYKRYGALVGKDLVSEPQLAATPAVGFTIAALYWSKNGLSELADVDNFQAITQKINGGQNGAAERARFYSVAQEVLKDAFPARASSERARAAVEPAEDFPRGAEAVRESAGKPSTLHEPRGNGKSHSPAAAHRVLDARPDTMDFRDIMYVPTLVEVPTHIPLGDYLDYDVPILDQGSEGACTGFGLATVANFLLLRRRVIPDPVPVSARMLYDLARRYDEWPGEDYTGSSARGAMKGWHKHGVCAEEMYPSRTRRPDSKGLTDARTSEARRRPLGAYFRVNHKDIVAMHSAIAEVGILYATCAVHRGWQEVGADGVIHASEQILGGHAFAIVAYDDEGLWIQNSWGPTWGRGGFGRIGYDDWLRNGTDVWVARLGAPVTLRTLESTATAHASTSGQSVAYSFGDLRPHIISVGNNGELKAGGDYGVTPEGLRHIFEEDIPRVTRGWGKLRILLYAHGGLVGQQAAVQRLAEYRPALLQGQVYPLAFVWRSDYWTTITNILQDAVRRRRPEGVLDAAKDFMLDRLDDALEPVARALTGKSAWNEMKENALAASGDKGAARMVADHLASLKGQDVEIHLVGHSAGSILHAPIVKMLADHGLAIESCTLWAPACTVELFRQKYLPAIQSGIVRRFSLFVLNDEIEQADNCAKVYNKSLLYLVSNAFEGRGRIPGFRDGVPLLGMEKFLDGDLRALFKNGRHRLVLAPNQEAAGSGIASEARRHGDFDDDPATVASTFASIVGRPFAKEAAAGENLHFQRSGSALRDRRMTIDSRTALDHAR